MTYSQHTRLNLALMTLLVSGSCTAAQPIDFAGTWEIASESRSRPEDLGQPRITLAEDGSFKASGIQEGLFYNPQSLTGSGTWKHRGPNLSLVFTADGREVLLGINDEQPPRLFFYRGDRMSGYRLFFVKR